MSIWWMIILLVVSTVVSLFLLAYVLAKKDTLVTTLSTWEVKFIDHGETLHRIIHNTPGYKLDENNRFVPTTEKPKRPFLGIYWVGIPPFASVRRFTISKERENPLGTTVENWITRGEDEEVSSLRFYFPRPYVIPKVELGKVTPVSVDILAVSKFRVVDPVKMVYGLHGKFFENAAGIVKAGVGDILNDYDLPRFIEANKGEDGDMLAPLRGPGSFNSALEKQIGMVQEGIALSYDPAHKALREAMEAKTIAIANGEAIKATADATYHKNVREAQAKAMERELRIKATLSGFSGNAEAATKVLVAEARPNVTTEVTSGATPVVPIGGKP